MVALACARGRGWGGSCLGESEVIELWCYNESSGSEGRSIFIDLLGDFRQFFLPWDLFLWKLRLRIRFPMRSLYFSIDLILPVLLWPGGGVDSASNATSTHRRTFSARPRVGTCRRCARPRATNVRHSGRMRVTMRFMSVFLFRIEGRSCPNTRKHERPDYTSRAAQSLVSEQSEQFSCTEVTS
jgi:hypothetical protein